MDFEFSEKSQRIQAQLKAFIAEHVVPRDAEYKRIVEQEGVFPPPFIDELKAKARAQGLWNLFLPGLKPDEPGTQMSNLDYAPCAEIMGRHALVVRGVQLQRARHRQHGAAAPRRDSGAEGAMAGAAARGPHPLAFAMTEPDVASSDATNIRTSIRRDGGNWVINGRKWFITNAADPRTQDLHRHGPDEPRPARARIAARAWCWCRATRRASPSCAIRR